MAKLIVGVNDLLTTNPEIAKEWDYDKNASLRPSDVTAGSSKKVWWKCSACGNEWCAVIYSRKNGNGCPLCGRSKQALSFRKKRISKNGSLLETHPDLCKEWNYLRNMGKLPEEFSYGSNQKVWWICTHGHEWESTISSRTQGTGCPKCNAGMRTSLPEKTIVYYLKQYGFEIKENARVLKNTIRDVDIYLPDKKIAVEYDGEHWHKNKNKDIHKTELCKENGIRLIRIREPLVGVLDDGYSIEHLTGIPKNDLGYINESIKWLLQLLGIKRADIDANRDMPHIRALIEKTYEEGSFGNLYPDIVGDWDVEKNGDLSPYNVSKSSGIRVWWKCKHGHSWQDTIAHRIGGRGCPYCSGRRTLSGFNDLKTKCPDIAKEWDYSKNGKLLPSNISYKNGRKVWWICPTGHSYTATVAHRTEDGTGCPFCSNQKVLVGFNDLLSNRPIIASEWDFEKNKDISPSDVVVNSNKKAWWKCAVCGNEWKATISSRTLSNSGCPVCSRKKAGDKHRITATESNGSLQVKFPELSEEWHDSKNGEKTPNDFPAGSSYRAWWKCRFCGNEWESRISNRSILGRGCPKCAVDNRAHSKSKAVRCIDTDTIFNSINDAASYSKVSPSKISACCRGKQKTAGGHHWEYLEKKTKH